MSPSASPVSMREDRALGVPDGAAERLAAHAVPELALRMAHVGIGREVQLQKVRGGERADGGRVLDDGREAAARKGGVAVQQDRRDAPERAGWKLHVVRRRLDDAPHRAPDADFVANLRGVAQIEARDHPSALARGLTDPVEFLHRRHGRHGLEVEQRVHAPHPTA